MKRRLETSDFLQKITAQPCRFIAKTDQRLITDRKQPLKPANIEYRQRANFTNNT